MNTRMLVRVAVGAGAGYTVARVIGARGGLVGGASMPVVAAIAGALIAYKLPY